MMTQSITLNEFMWIWNATQKWETPALHLKMSDFLTTSWEKKQNALLMAFRNAGKSTIVGLFCVWILLHFPNTRILILSADFALAKKMVRNIKRIIESHPLTKGLRPQKIDQWASSCLTINRPTDMRDPSVIAFGLGANITGARADLIICDDVEVPNSCGTIQKQKDLRERLTELDFIANPNSVKIYIGTPHTFDTIYNTGDTGFLRGFSTLKVPILNEKGQSQWPQRFSLDEINRLQMQVGALHFSSQMLLRPVQKKDARLDTNLLRWYDDKMTYTESNLTALLTIGDKKMVAASCWWDPSFGKLGKGDNSVIACVFQDAQGFYYLHDLTYIIVPDDVADNATYQCAQVADFVMRNHLPSICLETNGIGKFLPEVLHREFASRGIRCAIISKTSSRSKETRILEAFDAILSDRALFVHRHIMATLFPTEMRSWVPFTHCKDDGLDAVSGCLLTAPVRLPRIIHDNLPIPDWRFNNKGE